MTPLNQVVSSVTAANQTTSPEGVREMVLSVIAEVTRYPRDILQPEADLEEELGIDSVKRAEIFVVLQSRFQLPDAEGPGPANLRTIGDVIAAMDQYLRPPSSVARPAAVAESVTAAESPRAPAPASPHRRVIDIIAEVTNTPHDILVPAAHLEDDLGFDAHRRAGIGAALQQQLSISAASLAAVTTARTVGDILSLVERSAGAAAVPAEPAIRVGSSAPQPQSVTPHLLATRPFDGRIALVTGSGHGLGKVIASQLARLGATVVVNSFHSRSKGVECAEQINADGGKAVHLWGSVANPTQLDAIFDEIGNRFGGLDFLVSNASNGVFARLADVEAEHWDKAFRTNVIGLHRGALRAAELMRPRGGGKIVAISANASQRYVDYFGCMGPVKAAVECLVRYLAIELGADNIQVNAVAAGPVYGELLDSYPDGDRLRPLWEATVPRRRLNDEQEVTDAVTFLLGSSGMSGSVLLVDAGGSQRITTGPR